MSSQAEEKPKLKIIISHQKTDITIVVKATTLFSRVFEAAEKRFNVQTGTFKFIYQGDRIRPNQTPAEVGMEDGDCIDAHLEQEGGSRPLS